MLLRDFEGLTELDVEKFTDVKADPMGYIFHERQPMHHPEKLFSSSALWCVHNSASAPHSAHCNLLLFLI
jgi:hypothetical protein